MSSLLGSLPLILPIVHAWAEKQEALFLAQGVPLTEGQLADARQAGVAQPEKIRVLLAETLPLPENEDIQFLAKQVGLLGPKSSGLCAGYGICLQKDFEKDRYALLHECIHVAQHEKLGGIRPFLQEYLRECIEPGYPFGHMEQEAIRVAKHICKLPERQPIT